MDFVERRAARFTNNKNIIMALNKCPVNSKSIDCFVNRSEDQSVSHSVSSDGYCSRPVAQPSLSKLAIKALFELVSNYIIIHQTHHEKI